MRMEGTIALDPDLLSVHESNVRKTANPALKRIKDSIRADGGVDLIFTVSRESDNHPWSVVNGSGTRLKAVQQLKSENKDNDNPFSMVLCKPVPWKPSIVYRMGSFRENTARGDMSYAETCEAVEVIRNEWGQSKESERSTDAEFLQFIEGNGVSLSRSAYNRMKSVYAILLPCLPKYFYQGRALDIDARTLLAHRTDASRAISNSDKSLGPLVLSKQDAKDLYAEHFRELSRKSDAIDLDTSKFLSALNRRISSALCVEVSHFEARLKNKPVPSPASNRDPRVQEAIGLVTKAKPGAVASHFEAADTFDSALLLLSSLPDSDVIALLKPLRESPSEIITNREPLVETA